MRVLHFSDIHVDAPLSSMPFKEMLGKRLLGAANLKLRRAGHFRDAPEKLQQLARFARDEAVDLVICTGDYTALGTEPELQAARAAIDDLTHAPQGFVTVPGNHDLYMPDTVADGRFERYFGGWMETDLPELSCEDGWPKVKLLGDSLAVVSVNSARPNPQLWRSSGRIPDAQLDALPRVLQDARLRERFVFLLTHYAPLREDGTPDRPHHGMENAEALLNICAGADRLALLHGHIHWRYHVRSPRQGVPIFGAGSATYAGREGFWIFEVEEGSVRAYPGGYRAGRYGVDRGTCVEL